MEKLSYKLPEFEGPLDLLLYLISKSKLNICDIQISLLLRQYMDRINAMKKQDMDITSEFLEMAARLVYIKSISLLPKHEEVEQLKRELTGQLLEYQECKKVALMLSDKINYDIYSREPTKVDFDMTYKRMHKLNEIYKAYLNAVGKKAQRLPPSKEDFADIVSKKIVSVSSRIIFVLRRLWKVKEIKYNSLFSKSYEKSEMVATFLAILELVKGNRVIIKDESSDIKLVLVSGGAENWK